MGFPCVFLLIFTPLSPQQPPKQTSAAKAGELHSSWKAREVAKKMSRGVVQPWSGCQEERMGAPQGIGAA